MGFVDVFARTKDSDSLTEKFMVAVFEMLAP
ncbi:uncharacterized protein METZ01_LOCUS308103, partial [marine metagenome]